MTSRQIIGGPAAITYNGFTYFTEGDIALTPQTESRVIESSWHGPVSARHTDRAVELTFTPLGVIPETGGLAPYLPYAAGDLGKMVAPGTDRDAVVTTAAGVTITLKAAVVTAVPDIHFGTGSGPFGQMAITAMGGTLANKAEGAAGSLFAVGSTSSFSAALDASLIATPGYQLTLSPDEGDDVVIDGEDGFDFTCGMTLTPVRVNAYGTVNYQLTAIAPRLTFRPVGPGEADALAWLLLQGSAAGPLGSPATLGLSGVLAPVAGRGITLAFPDCQVTGGTMAFGASSRRHGEYTLTPVPSGSSPAFALDVTEGTEGEGGGE